MGQGLIHKSDNISRSGIHKTCDEIIRKDSLTGNIFISQLSDSHTNATEMANTSRYAQHIGQLLSNLASFIFQFAFHTQAMGLS